MFFLLLAVSMSGIVAKTVSLSAEINAGKRARIVIEFAEQTRFEAVSFCPTFVSMSVCWDFAKAGAACSFVTDVSSFSLSDR